MGKTRSPKNLVFFSETIFSDRICNQILKYNSSSNISVVFSDEVKELDQKLKDNSRNFLYRIRVIIVRNFVELMRYVAPIGADDVALKDHLTINSISWRFYKKYFFIVAIKIFRNLYFLRKLMLRILLFFIPKDIARDIFPKLTEFNVIVFSVGNLKSLSVLSFIGASKKFKGTKSFTFIQSWDNPSTKGYGALRTDFFLTWTELMREEIKLYQDIPSENSIAVGSPSLLPKKILEKINYQSSYNHSDKQKIIFATKSPASYKSNIDIAKALAIFSIDNNCELEVRIHPLSLVRKSNELEKMIKLSKKYNFYIRYPKSNQAKVMLDSNKDNLAYTSKPNDILITIYSTMNIEAAYLGIKCINIDFATKEGKEYSPRVNIKIDRRQLHNQRILNYGYIHNVYSMNNLIETIKKIRADNNKSIENKNKQQILINKECLPMYDVDYLLQVIR